MDSKKRKRIEDVTQTQLTQESQQNELSGKGEFDAAGQSKNNVNNANTENIENLHNHKKLKDENIKKQENESEKVAMRNAKECISVQDNQQPQNQDKGKQKLKEKEKEIIEESDDKEEGSETDERMQDCIITRVEVPKRPPRVFERHSVAMSPFFGSVPTFGDGMSFLLCFFNLLCCHMCVLRCCCALLCFAALRVLCCVVLRSDAECWRIQCGVSSARYFVFVLSLYCVVLRCAVVSFTYIKYLFVLQSEIRE